MSTVLRRLAKERAHDCCEYCGLHQRHSVMSFHIEHIIPRQHGGLTVLENLALACPNCNLHKGPNLTGIDPDTNEVCRLFHPRKDVWREHFKSDGLRVSGCSAVGRTTVWLLGMNSEDQQRLRNGG